MSNSGSATSSYPVGTKIRLHVSGSSRNYRAASNVSVPNTWTKYEGIT